MEPRIGETQATKTISQKVTVRCSISLLQAATLTLFLFLHGASIGHAGMLKPWLTQVKVTTFAAEAKAGKFRLTALKAGSVQ